MVVSTVPVDKHDSHGKEDPTTATAAHTSAAGATNSPSVNVWDVRKEAMKPSAEADAEKRVESIIENIKEVTLGKCGALCFYSFW